jgi:type 1 glutamine amidotransferase
VITPSYNQGSFIGAARASRSLLLLGAPLAIAFATLTGNSADSASDGAVSAKPDAVAAKPGAVAAKPTSSVLVYSRTTGFRHDSIPAGIEAIRKLGTANGFRVAATESPGAFTRKRLRRYRAVVFLNTTGDVLPPKGQAAFRRFIRAGGGFVGVHSAADTEHDWPFYGGLVGAYFASHPAVQPATVDVGDRRHPSTRRLPARWMRTDEWYNFRSNPLGSVHVLATVDESTYAGGTMGSNHPIAWCHRYRGGRAWYTAGGHTPAAFAEPLFRAHLLGGIRWASGAVKGHCAVR